MSESPSVTVLHVVTSTHRRGAETFAADLAEAMDGDGIASRLVALGRADRPPELAITALAPRSRSTRAVAALRRAARGVDVVVAHGSATLPVTALALAATRTPFVYRLIGDPTYWVRSAARRRRVGLLLRRATAVAVYYPAAADALVRMHGLAPDRIAVIPKGLPLDRYPPVSEADRTEARTRFGLSPSDPVAAFVGALDDEKDPLLAAEVAARAGVALLVAGDGPLRSSLAARREPNLAMIGSVADVRPVIAAADLVLSTSRTEGVPGGLIEAGLAGVPAVATDVGGTGEVVVDGETGRLVATRSTDELAAAVTEVVAERGRLGAAARDRCRTRFDLRDVAERWRELAIRTARGRPG